MKILERWFERFITRWAHANLDIRTRTLSFMTLFFLVVGVVLLIMGAHIEITVTPSSTLAPGKLPLWRILLSHHNNQEQR